MSMDVEAKELLKSMGFKFTLLIGAYLLLVGVVEVIDLSVKSGWKTFNEKNSPLSNYQRLQINEIISDEDGSIWVGTDEGLYKITANGDWVSFTSENTPMILDDVDALTIDKSGNVWVSTGWEVYAFSSTGDLVRSVRLKGDPDHINTMVIDSGNQIWIGTSEGLYVLDGNGNTTAMYTSKDSGLIDDEIRTLAVDQLDRIWVGTDREGISVYDQKGGWITHQAEEGGLRSNVITNFLFDQKGQVWIGTSRGGVNILDANGNWVSGILNPKYDDYSIMDSVIDKRGNVWIAMGDGNGTILSCVCQEEAISYTDDNSNLPQGVSSLEIDANNQLWIGTSAGLRRIDLDGKLPGKVPYEWIIARLIIQLPLSLMAPWVDFLEEIFTYFWYGLVPIIVAFIISAIGIYQGIKRRSTIKTTSFAVLLLITITASVFFCLFMVEALFYMHF